MQTFFRNIPTAKILANGSNAHPKPNPNPNLISNTNTNSNAHPNPNPNPNFNTTTNPNSNAHPNPKILQELIRCLKSPINVGLAMQNLTFVKLTS